jgi:hypothetical protein
MDSYYAPAGRKDGDELLREIEFISENPVIDTLLKSVSGFLAVLNEDRQILAVNEVFFEMLGVENAGELLGLRLGEAIHCTRAHDPPAGCGTTRFCSSCGAAIAMVATLASDKPEERDCLVAVTKNGKQTDLCLKIRAHPLVLHEKRFLFIFLRDITTQQRRAASERVFFHDINNLILGLSDAADSLEFEDEKDGYQKVVHIKRLLSRLRKEVEIQNVTSGAELCGQKLAMRGVSAAEIFREIRSIFSHHPAAEYKSVDIHDDDTDRIVKTDLALVVRVLKDMLINALEATRRGGQARIWLEDEENAVVFCVWNRETMGKNVARRIFRRGFSTKKEAGRGFGTYNMKSFAERYLEGKVSFTTDKSTGTTFRLELPGGSQAGSAHDGSRG